MNDAVVVRYADSLDMANLADGPVVADQWTVELYLPATAPEWMVERLADSLDVALNSFVARLDLSPGIIVVSR